MEKAILTKAQKKIVDFLKENKDYCIKKTRFIGYVTYTFSSPNNTLEFSDQFLHLTTARKLIDKDILVYNSEKKVFLLSEKI